MKGYYTHYGYEGYIPSIGNYMLFASEGDYLDYFFATEECQSR